MLKWPIVLLTLIASSCLAYQPPISVTVYGDDAYPPYSYGQNGTAHGIYSDILREIFARMPEYRVEIVPIPWKRGLKMLEVGEGFALYPPYYYSDKRAYISPYSEPILNEEVVVYCRPEQVTDRKLASWPDDYFGLTVGINEAFALGGSDFWHAVRQGKINLREAKGNRANILNLYNKKTDCYINDRLSILWEIKLLIQEGIVNPDWMLTLGTSIGGEQGYLGYSNVNSDKFPFKADFVAKFNQTLEQLRIDGTVEAIMARYLNHSSP